MTETGTARSAEAVTLTSRPIFWVAVALAVALFVFVAVLATSDTDGGREAKSPLLGLVAPPVVGDTLDGGTYDLDGERGRWVVVNFFSPSCLPCIDEQPELIDFANRGRARGDASVVSVAFGAQRRQEVSDFFLKYGGDWPVVTGDTSSIALDYVATRVPESFLVDPAGRVQAKLIGGVTAAQLEGIIARVEGAETTPGTS